MNTDYDHVEYIVKSFPFTGCDYDLSSVMQKHRSRILVSLEKPIDFYDLLVDISRIYQAESGHIVNITRHMDTKDNFCTYVVSRELICPKQISQPYLNPDSRGFERKKTKILKQLDSYNREHPWNDILRPYKGFMNIKARDYLVPLFATHYDKFSFYQESNFYGNDDDDGDEGFSLPDFHDSPPPLVYHMVLDGDKDVIDRLYWGIWGEIGDKNPDISEDTALKSILFSMDWRWKDHIPGSR